MTGGYRHSEVPRILDELTTAGRRRREEACDALAEATLGQGAVPFLVLQTAEPAHPTVLYASRYWQRRIAQDNSPLTTAVDCGTWIDAHALSHLHDRLLEDWLLRTHAISPQQPAEVDALVRRYFLRHLSPAALYAAVLYRAGHLWQHQAAPELTSWLTSSALATALPDARRGRYPLLALQAWAQFWDSGAASGQAYLLWSRAWGPITPRNELAADILLDALASPWHYEREGHLLATPDRLTRHAAKAAQDHPHSHRVRYHYARGLRQIGEHRQAAATLWAARRLLPHHRGADHCDRLYRAELRALTWNPLRRRP